MKKANSIKLAGLLPLSRLRTVHDSFPSYGSSISSRFRAAIQENLVAIFVDVGHVTHLVLAAHGFWGLEEKFSLVVDFHGKSTVITTPTLVFPDLFKPPG